MYLLGLPMMWKKLKGQTVYYFTWNNKDTCNLAQHAQV